VTFNKGQIVLLDTNVIIEAHRVNCWNAIADFYSLETVEKCVEETQTGAQNRSPEENIDQTKLVSTLRKVHRVTAVEKANFLLKQKIQLDPGERDLLCHAANRQDVWVVSSPDKAAMRFVFAEGWLDKLVSLEALCSQLKIKNVLKLQRNYTEDWHAGERLKLHMGM
jgi:hypothetical protein